MGRIRETTHQNDVGGHADRLLGRFGGVVRGRARAVALPSLASGGRAALASSRAGTGILGALRSGGRGVVSSFVSSMGQGIGGRFGRAAAAEASMSAASMLRNSALASRHPIVGHIADRVQGSDRMHRKRTPGEDEPKRKRKPKKEHEPEEGGHQGNKDRGKGGQFT